MRRPTRRRNGIAMGREATIRRAFVSIATAAALIGLVTNGPAAAQDVSGVISGTVVDTTGSPLAQVDVIVLGLPTAHARTGSSGAYRIDSVPPGLHPVRYRRLGIVPMVVSVPVRGAEVTRVDLVMEMVPHSLATVLVQDTLGELSRLPADVVARVRNGVGTYITASDIELRHPTRTSQMLQYVAGAEITKDGGVNNTRGIISLMTVGCKYGMPVYIDGSRVADPHFGADTLHGRPLVDYVPPSAVAVIEVYRGSAGVPAPLPQNPCGGLFIWTKR